MSGAALAALDYARRGWRVFPCHSPAGGACSCGAGGGCASPAKHPRTRHGLHDASAEEADVRRWWRRWPDANVGLRTGAGLVVLDVDPAHGGTTSLAALEAAIGPLPETMTVRTGGGGLHLYFSHPGSVRNSAGALGPGLDVRGEGGYVIAPPSWHVSGAPYRWSASVSLAPLPAGLLDRLNPPPLPRRGVDMAAVRPGPQASAWAGAALAGEVDRVVTAPVGQRNHTLNRAAFVLGQIVGAGHLDVDEVADLLGRAGEACGLSAQEAAATVASGLGAGQRWPRHPPQRPAPVAVRPGRARPDASPEAARTLDAFVDECARRLHSNDGTGIRRWLDAHGLCDDVLRNNRVGADPGAHLQRRPAGMPAAGPAVVLPILHSRRVVSVQIRPLHPGAGGQVLTPSGAAPPVALVRPVAEAGPCVVVARGMFEALAACSAGYRGAALLHPQPPASSAGWDDVAQWLCDLGAPVAVALGPAPTAELRRALHQLGVAAAAVHVPRGDDLSSWMAGSRDWRRELSAGLRAAWTCEHQARRVTR